MRRIIVVAILAAIPVVALSQIIAAPQNTKQPSKAGAKKQVAPNAKLAADSQNDERATETAAIKSLADAIAKYQEAANSKQQEGTQQTSTKAQWWLVWVGIAQTLALILTFGALVYQTRKTAAAANAATEAAVEAKRSTQIIIDKERARLYVEALELSLGDPKDPPNMSGIMFKVSCHGTTEANVISANGEIALTGKGDTPNLKTNGALNLPAVIPPDDKGLTRMMVLGGVAGTDARARFMKGELCANFHGWIVYRDIFKSVWEYEFSYIKMYDDPWIGTGGTEKPYADDKHGLFE